MKSITKLKHFVLLVALASIFLFGCTNLKSVRKFSESARVSTASFPAIAEDISASCERRQEYVKVDLRVDCTEESKAKEDILILHQVLIDYISVLGTLAEDGLVATDKEFLSLKGEVGKIDGLDKKQIDAISGLAEYVSNLILGIYQNKKVKKIISENNENFQVLVSTMKANVDINYAGILLQEIKRIEDYYDTEIAKNSQEKLAVILAEEVKKKKLEMLEQKESAITAYVEVLDNISIGHQDLYDGKDNLSSKELLKKIIKQGKEFRKLIKEISKAF